ncbi:MAG: hypothetical protein M3O46_14145 [Myxococcota bacterium]|nr:hypothetical protein [Myxococcota bacterium]
MAAISCIDTSGSRTDFATDGDSGITGGGDTGTSSGSSESGESSGSGSPDTGPVMPDSCGFRTTTAPNPVLYAGAPTGTGVSCSTSIPMPRNASWFHYDDMTGDGGVSVVAKAEIGGCGGTSVCAYHARTFGAGGFTNYGAGIGFDLLDDAMSVATNYDATPYTGIQYWVKGTITGTRGPNFAAAPQTIHLKLVTATDRHGDDYGAYCQMIDPQTWTRCTLDFSAAKRDGFSSVPAVGADTLDIHQLRKIQFEFSRLADPTATVSFDVWIDEVAFY